MKIAKPVLLLLFLTVTALLAALEISDPGKTNVTYKSSDTTELKGYLAVPKGDGPFPAVLMIHEWWGLNNDITTLADALSREGYLVLAADGFRGKVAKTPQEAMKQVKETPQAQIAQDIDAAFAFLKSNPKVDVKRIASLGFCFGGTQSMYLGTRNPGLAAVVIFYGPGPITDAEKLGKLTDGAPVLGIFGADDPNIPVKDVQAFDIALKTKGVTDTVTIYPGVGHAFVKSNTYQAGTAQKAWKQMTGFLKIVFKI